MAKLRLLYHPIPFLKTLQGEKAGFSLFFVIFSLLRQVKKIILCIYSSFPSKKFIIINLYIYRFWNRKLEFTNFQNIICLSLIVKKVPFISFHIKVPFKLPSLRPCKIYAKFRTGDSSLFFWENSLTKKALRQILKKVILLKNSIAYFLPIKQFRFPTAHTKQKQEEKPQSLSSCQTRCIRMSFLLFPPAGLLPWLERRFSPHGRNR